MRKKGGHDDIESFMVRGGLRLPSCGPVLHLLEVSIRPRGVVSLSGRRDGGEPGLRGW